MTSKRERETDRQNINRKENSEVLELNTTVCTIVNERDCDQ
jgi:hypothetical protein